jgi:hypothetical protein
MMRNLSAPFRTFLNERRTHARRARSGAVFEQAGVARTEGSIINWCHPNRQGISRLDAYFDENERRYLITPQTVQFAIGEEQAKQSAEIPAVAREIPKASAAVKTREQRVERRMEEIGTSKPRP